MSRVATIAALLFVGAALFGSDGESKTNELLQKVLDRIEMQRDFSTTMQAGSKLTLFSEKARNELVGQQTKTSQFALTPNLFSRVAQVAGPSMAAPVMKQQPMAMMNSIEIRQIATAAAMSMKDAVIDPAVGIPESMYGGGDSGSSASSASTASSGADPKQMMLKLQLFAEKAVIDPAVGLPDSMYSGGSSVSSSESASDPRMIAFKQSLAMKNAVIDPAEGLPDSVYGGAPSNASSSTDARACGTSCLMMNHSKSMWSPELRGEVLRRNVKERVGMSNPYSDN